MEKVVIVMGSESDETSVKPAINAVRSFSIECGVYCLSAHRNPKGLNNFIKKLNDSGQTLVVIAAAGMSAVLPGVIAAQTSIPVIGLPLSGSALNGQDALYAMAQMPSGVPVATVGIDAAKNAGLLAVRIVGLQNSGIALAIERYNEDQAEKNEATNNRVHQRWQADSEESE